jgi:hypothetical protein
MLIRAIARRDFCVNLRMQGLINECLDIRRICIRIIIFRQWALIEKCDNAVVQSTCVLRYAIQ